MSDIEMIPDVNDDCSPDPTWKQPEERLLNDSHETSTPPASSQTTSELHESLKSLMSEIKTIKNDLLILKQEQRRGKRKAATQLLSDPPTEPGAEKQSCTTALQVHGPWG